MAHIRTFRSKKLHPEHTKLLNEAIRRNAKGGDQNVHISYRKPDGSLSDRKVKPLAVKGKSLFVAHCHKRNAIRSFRVERIEMIKQAFWDGFEKRAVSGNWVRRGTAGGIVSRNAARIGKTLTPGDKAKEVNELKSHWRRNPDTGKLLPKKTRQYELADIHKMNQATKDMPKDVAQKAYKTLTKS